MFYAIIPGTQAPGAGENAWPRAGGIVNYGLSGPPGATIHDTTEN